MAQGSAPDRRFTDRPDRITSVIGEDVVVTGEIRGPGSVEIHGSFEGTLEVDGLAWIHKAGRFKGKLTAGDVVVEGAMNGTTTAANKVDLRTTCRLEGDITARAIAAAEGSHFEGKIRITGGDDRSGVVTYQEKRQSSRSEE